MKVKKIGSACLVLFLCSFPTLLSSSEKSISELVDAVNGTFDDASREAGRKVKLRNHIKGFCTSGSFVPNSKAYNDFNIPMLNESKISVTARFSLSGTNPKVSDKTKSRFMALVINGNTESFGFVMSNVPVFFAKDADELYNFLIKTKQGKNGISWLKKNQPAAKNYFKYIDNMKFTDSFAENKYYGINSFLLDKKDGTKVAARWIFEPKQDEYVDNKTSLSDNFLKDELLTRINKTPVKWNFYIQLAKDGDDILNPAVTWSDDNKKILLGELSIDGLNDGKDEIKQCGDNVFNPVLLPAGITPSDDPILQLRAPAYFESLSRRL